MSKSRNKVSVGKLINSNCKCGFVVSVIISYIYCTALFNEGVMATSLLYEAPPSVATICALHSPCSDEDFQLHCNCLDDDHVLLPAILAS